MSDAPSSDGPPRDGAEPPGTGAAVAGAHAKDTPRQRLLRLGFLALLAGGLVLWTELRKPREMAVELDLASALPGELREVDLVVTRDGQLLSRQELHYEAGGAPQIVRSQLRARAGSADLEADLIYRARPASRARAHIELRAAVPARVTAEKIQ